jgi:nucleoside-diphosphate-sugar epimerase
MSGRRILITGGSGFIGTNYIDELASIPDIRICNLDCMPPKKPSHNRYWTKCDILDASSVLQTVRAASPTEVVHLAARTDMAGETVEDYAANSAGTQNIVEAVRVNSSIQRVVFTSSQYVVGPGPMPRHELDFRPHTVYGQSKVVAEKIVREAGLPCCWTIIRPTNVWGSWHPRYATEFWRVLRRGRYVHPGKKPVIRSYGYVRTVIGQIEGILSAPANKVNGKVFYTGDPSLNLLDWVNAFSMELTSRPVRVVPRWIVRALALLGDIVKACGMSFPIFTSRYRSMTQNYDTPMEATFVVLGKPQISLTAGVRETVDWLREQDEYWR